MNGTAENRFCIIEGMPSRERLKDLFEVYSKIFNTKDQARFLKKISNKKDLLIVLTYKNKVLAGFKIGFAHNTKVFYSWSGGVLDKERKQGFASKMAQIQEDWVKQNGYKKIRTKSTNQFKPMMILNLKRGFDIVRSYHDGDDNTEVIFEKTLL